MGNCARHENAVGRFFPRCAPRYTAPRCRGAALLTVFGMSRYAIYVDVGYLYAEGGRLLSGLRQPRHAVHLDYDRFVPFLSDFVGSRQARHELLRIYWYDGARGAPTPAQLAIGYRDQIKLRLGLIDASGQQRGVDALSIVRYNVDIPKPDLIVFLDLEPKIVLDRIMKRDKGNLAYEERDFSHVTRVRENFLAIAALDPDIVVLDATESADTIERRILELHDAALVH